MATAQAGVMNLQSLAGEITEFTKSGGPLTKRISLAADGSIVSDGSACVMSRGTARRIKIAGVKQLGELIEQLSSDQAIALGALRTDLPDQVKVVTKDKLNGVAQPNVIARTAADIHYREQQPAFALLDSDSKGMPPEVAAEIDRLGFWGAMLVVLPALRDVARVTRRSTSSGLFRSDTEQKLPGSNNAHTYVAVQDGADIERFLKTLHDRCWLAGFGWMMVGAGGQLLERSIVDRMVGGPERLVFEGAPVLKPPLKQDRKSRRAVVTEGETLDTVAACPPLTIAEKAKLDGLKAKAAHQLAPESAKARTGIHQAASGGHGRAHRHIGARRRARGRPPMPRHPAARRGAAVRRCRNSPAARSARCWPIPNASRAPPWPIRSRACRLWHDAAPRSCAGRMARRGSTASPTAAPSTS